MLEIQNLSKWFNVRGGEAVKAIDEVSFDVAPGEFLLCWAHPVAARRLRCAALPD